MITPERLKQIRDASVRCVGKQQWDSDGYELDCWTDFTDSVSPEVVVVVLDLLDRYEAALERMVKPCAGMIGCDCLSGAQCAEIAREALEK